MPRNPLTSHGYQCPYCKDRLATLKGLRMHGGYGHKTEIRKRLRELIAACPGITTAGLCNELNIEPSAVNKYLTHMSDIQMGSITKGGRTWYKKDQSRTVKIATTATPTPTTVGDAADALEHLVEKKVAAALSQNIVVQPKTRRAVPLTRWQHFKAVFKKVS